MPGWNKGYTVYRLSPGAQQWEAETSLPCANDFELAPDGTLWATGCFPNGMYRLARGASTWTTDNEGLPLLKLGVGDIAIDEDGTLYVASSHGTWRRSGSTWERLGYGEPSVSATRITSRAGKTWALADGAIHSLDDASGSWLRLATPLPLDISDLAIFEATPNGTLVLSGRLAGIGLLELIE
jgi:hypothetical protein